MGMSAMALEATRRGKHLATLNTLKSYRTCKQWGGGSGLVECVGSVLAMRHGELFPLLNHEVADEACGIRPARRGDPAGEVFVSTAVTPQGQSGSLVIRSWQDSA